MINYVLFFTLISKKRCSTVLCEFARQLPHLFFPLDSEITDPVCTNGAKGSRSSGILFLMENLLNHICAAMKFHFYGQRGECGYYAKCNLRDLVQVLKCQAFRNYDVQKAD